MNTDNKTIIQTNLPDKLWQLLDQAMQHLRECEADPDYVIEMDVWHDWSPITNKCHVCLAGAMLAKGVGIEQNRSFYYDFVVDENCVAKMLVLDRVRCGQVWRAVCDFYNNYTTIDQLTDLDRPMASYHVNRQEWHRQMGVILQDLMDRDL